MHDLHLRQELAGTYEDIVGRKECCLKRKALLKLSALWRKILKREQWNSSLGDGWVKRKMFASFRALCVQGKVRFRLRNVLFHGWRFCQIKQSLSTGNSEKAFAPSNAFLDCAILAGIIEIGHPDL